MSGRKKDCECLPWLDKLRLLHEEGKIDEFYVVFKETGSEKGQALMHRPTTKFLLEAASNAISNVLEMEEEGEH